MRLRLFLMETTTNVRDFIDLDVNLTSVQIGSAVNEVVAVDVVKATTKPEVSTDRPIVLCLCAVATSNDGISW